MIPKPRSFLVDRVTKHCTRGALGDGRTKTVKCVGFEPTTFG